MTLAAFLALISLPALAVAQDGSRLWADLAESRALPSLQQGQPQGDPRGRGGQVIEEWYTPQVRGSLSFYGRASFPDGSSEITIDHLTYDDFFDTGYGLSIEGDLLTYFTPHWAVGGYMSVGWDRFDGNTVVFPNGDQFTPNKLDLTSVIFGGKVLGRGGPFFTWEGRMGLGIVHYSSVLWSGIDTGVPFANEQLFRPINRAVFDIGARAGFGNQHIQGDFGLGWRIMGPLSRGKDVTNAIDPEVWSTFMVEVGLSIRF